MPAILAVLLAAVCFGTTGTAQALGPSADPVALGAARIAVGGIALAVVAVVSQRVRRGGADGSGRRRAHAAVAPRAWVAVGLGALGVLAYQPAFFAGTARNGVAVGTVIALGSAPVLTGLATWALGRGRPGRAWLVATALATTGVAVLGLAPSGAGTGGVPDAALAGAATGASGVDLVGVLMSVGAGAAYALYTLAGAALIDRGWTSTTTMGAMFGVAGVLSVGVLAAVGPGSLASGAGVVTVLWLGLVTTTAAYALFGFGLARLGAPTVATLTLAEPLTATVLGLAVLGERLSGAAVAGLVVLAAGLVVLAAGTRRPRLART